MKALKEYLEKIVEDDRKTRKHELAGITLEDGRADLASEILTEYLTDTKFYKCPDCKRLSESGNDKA